MTALMPTSTPCQTAARPFFTQGSSRSNEGNTAAASLNLEANR
jgi:hypothetical protein